MEYTAIEELETHETAWKMPRISDAEFQRLRDLIKAQTGIHLSDVKRHLLTARLGRRLRELNIPSFSAYHDLLVADPAGGEMRDFINRITTNKTSFFRETHHFAFLESQIIPQLRLAGRTQLRIWSAGCSSGEEPYSIAMTVQEALGRLHKWDVRILASDIDTGILARAAAGTYPMESLDEISQGRRRAHFLRGHGKYQGQVQVKPELRRMVEFRHINLNSANWGVHGRFDVVFCRNVIIYFDPPTQRRLVERLAGTLGPGGYFFSGHSESLTGLRDVLTLVQPTIYRLKNGGTAV